MTRLGYQIPNFTYPATEPAELFGKVIAQAKAAEDAGFDRVFVMDHFYQLPQLGQPEEPMFEAFALLSAIAQHTSKVRLSPLVAGNTYRHPTLLAKAITALDHVSNGRATLGIGCGWFEGEHASLGYEFGTFTDRFEKLEEALQIVLPMLKDERPSLEGKWYQVSEAINQPAPLSDIPIMIGGGGEKKTLRMVAQYADESNLPGGSIDEIPRKLEALAEHCQRLGRDRSEIVMTKLITCVVGPTKEQASDDLAEFGAVKGWDDEVLDLMKSFVIFGGPDDVAEGIAAAMATGIDGVIINAPGNGHIPERVSLLGEVALSVLG